ncbi:MAG: ABC transporter ATP-binding protein [Lachnospiraceae bacterium]|nr:ABC transporter ATP-binding protein [Lachnospiraceae bacterium]
MKLKMILSNIFLALRYYRKYVPLFFYGQIVFTIFVSAVWTVTGPITTKYLLDALAEGKPIKEVLLFLVAVTALLIVRHVFACYIVEYLETVANIRVQEKLLKELHEKASKMDLEYYETPQFYTDYVWAAQQATSEFANIAALFATMMARLSEFIFMGSVLVALNPVLILFALAMGITSFIRQRKQIKQKYIANMEAKPIERERDYAKRVFYLSDYAKEIRLSRIHEVIHDNFVDANKRLCNIRRTSGKKIFAIAAVCDTFIEIFETLGMYGYLAYEVIVSGALTFGDFGALSQSTARFSNRLRQILNIALDFAEASLYVDKFRRFMEYEPKIEKHKGEIPDKELKPLVLKNVSFTYNGESTPSLKNVNLTINPYEKVAIVGYNGAGKTTLIKLLMRLYDPTEGEILLGDKNIKEFDTDEYRKEFAAVFQDYQIFAATLGENVVMDSVSDGDEDRIKDALFHSDFEEKYKELPLGTKTPLTKEFQKTGVDLSGGEKQKVAIARAFYKNSHYAVMDEPSSALDPIAEYKLNQNMAEIAEDRTVIFISHRLSTTVMADKIYMFEKGEIIEQGTHRELMDLNGKYAEMFRKQSINYVS